MNIGIHDAQKNNQVIAVIQVALNGLNYMPSKDQYFEVAWLVAIEDGLVQEDNKSKYSFSSLNESSLLAGAR